MSSLGTFVWSIADQLRGVYKPHQYGDVILPFTILRRLDCILEPTRNTVRELASRYEGGALDAQVRRKTGFRFYNTSEFDFATLRADPEGLRSNLLDYINRFSVNIDVFERFKFENQIAILDEKSRLYLVVSKFAEVDLHPSTVPNAEMGDLFEELIRKFAEASNEEAGEHYTPRDAIRLIVDLLFAPENAVLLEPGVVRSIYDPTAGTGGMLSVAEERLMERNPQARLALYGQEINDQSYAICKSDMLAKGQDPSNIQLGDTLIDDKFAGRTFDFCMSNPPYGVDWKAAQQSVKAEAASTPTGRFGAGLPPVSDGQMLFLLHLVDKLRTPRDGGGRAGIVLNGSPLFSGGAESGSSEIRRWLLENDLIDAVIALPTNMFFNTGIPTYIWILDNNKPPGRKGQVQLVDARGMWAKLPKNLGNKTRELDADSRTRIVGIYDAFSDQHTPESKVVPNSSFGYWTVTVERPLLDAHGDPVIDRMGKEKPNPAQRTTENIPFTFGGNTLGDKGRETAIKTYFERNIKPYVPGAWINTSRTKVGYEIPFARLFRQDPDSFRLEEVVQRFDNDNDEATRLTDLVASFASDFAARAQEENWPIVPLRRVAKVVNGGTPKPHPSNWDGPYKWATPTDINNSDGFLNTTNRTVTETGLSATRLVPAGAVLVSSRAPIGSVAVLEVDAAFNQGCKGLIVDESLIGSYCLAFQLMASKSLMESLGQGTTFLEINADKLASVAIAIPPRSVQESLDFTGVITSFHRARRLYEALTDQARLRRRGLDLLIARGAASGLDDS